MADFLSFVFLVLFVVVMVGGVYLLVKMARGLQDAKREPNGSKREKSTIGSTADRCVAEARQHAARGLDSATIIVKQSDIGVLSNLDLASKTIVTRLQEASIPVVAVQHQPRSYSLSIRVDLSGLNNGAQRPTGGSGTSRVRPSGPGRRPLLREAGSAGFTMGPAELEESGEWMSLEFKKRTIEAARAVWVERMWIGPMFPGDELRQNTRFWLNAYPALAAAILHRSKEQLWDRDLAVLCADLARNEVDQSNDAQVEALESMSVWFEKP